MLDVTTIRDIRVIAPEEGEVLDVLGAAMIVIPGGGGGGAGDASAPFLAEHVVPPGYMVPPHVHEAEDESFHILDGVLTLLTPTGGERTVGPGATVLLPAGSRHGFRNDGIVPARFLVVVRPGTQAAAMFRHLDRAGRGGAAPGGLTPAEVGAICAQYGVRLG